MTGLAGSRTQLGSAIDNLATAESTTSGLLNEAQPTLNQDIQTLDGAVQSLSANQQGLDGVLQGFPGLVDTLTKIQSSRQLDQRLPLQPDDQRLRSAGHLARSRREPHQPVPESGHPALGTDR